jgi:hypothetical protein
MRIEVILLLYNRPHHSAAVLDSLAANGVRLVRAFVDQPGDPGVERNQEHLLELIHARSEPRIELQRSATRLGLARSVRTALSAVLSEADAAIVLEDDCVLRPGGIEYFRDALTRLRSDHRVRSVCGYLFPCEFDRGAGAPLLLRRFCPWGWATWRDRWSMHEPRLASVVHCLTERGPGLDALPADLARLCRSPAYLGNGVDVWSVSWAVEHYLSGTFAVYPHESKIDNIGFDGTGQHCPATTAFATTTANGHAPLAWDGLKHSAENDRLLNQFLAVHGAMIYPDA